MRTEAVAVSRWARYANMYLLRLCCERGGFCAYDPSSLGAVRLSYAKNPERLAAILRAKNSVVSDAERSNAQGDPWDDEDFKSVLHAAIGGAIAA